MRFRLPLLLLLSVVLVCARLDGKELGLPEQAGYPGMSAKERRAVKMKKLQERVEVEKKRLLEEAKQNRVAKGMKQAEATWGQRVETVKQPSKPAEAVLMLKPLNLSVVPGERFLTQVAVSSGNLGAFDRLEIRVSYPPNRVRPLRIYDFPLKHALDPAHPPRERFDYGLLSYEATTSRPVNIQAETPLINIVWEALDSPACVELRLAQGNAFDSSLFLGDHNLLKTKRMMGTACVNSTLEIVAKKSARGLDVRTDSDRSALPAVAPNLSARSVRLYLRNPEKLPRRGEEFVLDVMLDNPDNVAFDRVNLAIGYDRRRVEVLDWDKNGWIRRGVNLYDAHAHRNFPFDIHYANEALRGAGKITYRMATSDLAPRPSGSLARIRCRALGPGAVESFTLFPRDRQADWTTDVLAAGRGVLSPPTGSLADARGVSAKRE